MLPGAPCREEQKISCCVFVLCITQIFSYRTLATKGPNPIQPSSPDAVPIEYALRPVVVVGQSWRSLKVGVISSLISGLHCDSIGAGKQAMIGLQVPQMTVSDAGSYHIYFQSA